MKYKVKQNDLVGDIKGFPIEVVQKMVEIQVEQGNKADVKVFQMDHSSGRFECGFTWWETEEGKDFWEEVIAERNFDLFFERYPKSEH